MAKPMVQSKRRTLQLKMGQLESTGKWMIFFKPFFTLRISLDELNRLSACSLMLILVDHKNFVKETLESYMNQ